MSFEKLSKEISYALRHAPWEYELEMDENGWVDVAQLICALKLDSSWSTLSKTDIEEMVKFSSKQRHEILNGKIRALYGHSLPIRIKIEEKIPTEILYHGTSHEFINSIKKLGLLPMNRQYVHLSTDIETAVAVGKRRDSNPVILKIQSAQAYNDGIKFYQCNTHVWLVDKIEVKYIIF